jgi:hypothetical protein
MIVTTSEVLEQRIDARRRQAEMLLASASHDTMKVQLCLGLRDLDEASEWLHRDAGARPVHLLLDLAAWRLNSVVQMLRTEAGDAEVCRQTF